MVIPTRCSITICGLNTSSVYSRLAVWNCRLAVGSSWLSVRVSRLHWILSWNVGDGCARDYQLLGFLLVVMMVVVVIT